MNDLHFFFSLHWGPQDGKGGFFYPRGTPRKAEAFRDGQYSDVLLLELLLLSLELLVLELLLPLLGALIAMVGVLAVAGTCCGGLSWPPALSMVWGGSDHQLP